MAEEDDIELTDGEISATQVALLILSGMLRDARRENMARYTELVIVLNQRAGLAEGYDLEGSTDTALAKFGA